MSPRIKQLVTQYFNAPVREPMPIMFWNYREDLKGWCCTVMMTDEISNWLDQNCTSLEILANDRRMPGFCLTTIVIRSQEEAMQFKLTFNDKMTMSIDTLKGALQL